MEVKTNKTMYLEYEVTCPFCLTSTGYRYLKSVCMTFVLYAVKLCQWNPSDWKSVFTNRRGEKYNDN